MLEETTRPGRPHLLSLSSDSLVEGLVQEADRRVNAVALSITPSVRFRDRDQHNQESPNSPTGPVSESSSGPQPSTSTLRGGNDSNPPATQPIRRRKGQPPEIPVSSSQSLASEPQQQPSLTTILRGGNESNPQGQPIRRRKGYPPEIPVYPVNSSPPYVPPYQPRPSQGNVHSSSSQSLPSEPQQEPPSPTSTLHGSIESDSEATPPFRRRKGDTHKTPVSAVNSPSEYPPHVPPYQPHPSQGTVHSLSSHSLPLSQQPGVNEGNMNGCAAHGNNTSSQLATSPVNMRLPSSSKSRYHLQDPPSSGGRPIGIVGTSHLTHNRFNEWSQSSEDSSRDAFYGDDPPPSFNDALLAPVLGSRSEISHASTATGNNLFISLLLLLFVHMLMRCCSTFDLGPTNRNTP